ncbi:hypothetical protein FE257_003340 [Aspergillus nanangensis]|uniref:ER-bound oxygenase mpaB/mpaB'/Rubber oxygenase catalytic domain-containing protein n=1 Tax=Aspergillus nanangensis TaxID=2582783 RepID=A0AAD4CSF8_ASPNN|nr:hypothetical protein FE257_003340 [Aspergillus nanangensis]
MASSSISSDPEKTTALPQFEHPELMQEIVQEGLILGGGAAAILLQVANPGVAQGVDNHSNFSYRPLDRLRTTMTYVYCMTFGTPEEKRQVVEMVHRAHAPVQGADYNANDAGLQVWVAATLYAVGVDMYEQVFGDMDEDTAERIYREYAVLAVSLRVRPEQWPADRKAFWAYWDQMIETMEVGDSARNVAKDLLYNKHLPLYFRVWMPWVRLITAELLPPRLRDAYGLKSTKTRRGAYKATVSFARATYPFMPKVLRTWPKRYYLKDMRRRLRAAGHVI